MVFSSFLLFLFWIRGTLGFPQLAHMGDVLIAWPDSEKRKPLVGVACKKRTPVLRTRILVGKTGVVVFYLYFVSFLMVWAAGVNVLGPRPTGGILAQMCECVNSLHCAHLHIRRHIPPPSVGFAHGLIAQQSGRITR